MTNKSHPYSYGLLHNAYTLMLLKISDSNISHTYRIISRNPVNTKTFSSKNLPEAICEELSLILDFAE